MFWILLAACAPETAPAPFYAPDTLGPALIGTEEVETEGPGGLVLPTQLWFPASSADEGSYYEYDDLIAGTALEDGVPACEAPLPVLIFSHGNGGVRFQSIFFTERLASHGLLVAAPDHVGNTFFDNSTPRVELMERRPQDVAAVFDQLIALSEDPDSLIYGCVDADAGYIVAGHSFGGYTSLAVAGADLDVVASANFCDSVGGWLCEDLVTWSTNNPSEEALSGHDPRAWAALPMSPAGHEVLVGGLPQINIPTFILSGLQDDLTPWESQPVADYELLTVTPRALLGIDGAGHYSFSDACDLVPTYPDCDPPYRAPEDIHAQINTVATAWIKQLLEPERASEYSPWLPPAGDETLVYEEAR